MAVQKYRNAILPTFLDNRHQIVEIFFVINARSGVLDGLPREEEAEGGVSPADEAGEMDVGIVQGKRPADEGDVSVVVKGVVFWR